MLGFRNSFVSFVVGIFASVGVYADEGKFDMARWENMLERVRARATEKHISDATIDATLRIPKFIPAIVKNGLWIPI